MNKRFVEPVSPNVTMIRKGFPSMVDRHSNIFQNPVATLHKNGAIQIDCDRIDLNASGYLHKLFNLYKLDGHLYPVSVTGLKTGEDDPIGSFRFCNMDRNLADMVTDVVETLGVVPYNIVKGKQTFATHSFGEVTVGPEDQYHSFIRCSDYFRFMNYNRGGEHFPHYDSDFNYPNYKSLYTGYTVVIYFTDCETGEFAFVRDDRQNHGNEDWDRQATEDEITLRVKPKSGRILLFPHDLCHTVMPYTDATGQRIIARGDLIFQR